MRRMMRCAVRRWKVMTESPTTSGAWSAMSRVIVRRTWDCARIKSAAATLWCASTFPASEPSAPLGSRIAIEGMCSKESGIDSSSTFTTVLRGERLA